ncbi:MAG: hypothetical protein CVU63_08370 [Deltaproteobacteria bacterium HGW-Deltaproteobacteria-20]|jgi:hypothetical protein|nr:MAG: hypothetical protein CVU63_08370 [Deltaproteobacteria bacterium HGW-Deltaproteobacteria-20]
MQDDTHDPRGDEATPEALRIALGAMRERAPGHDALARMRANLGVPDPSGPGTPPDSPPAPSSGAASGLAGLSAVKALVVTGLAVTLGGLWWATTRDDSSSAMSTPGPAMSAPVELASSLPPSHSAIAPETPSPALSATAPVKPRRAESSASASPTGESEVQLIGRAQQLVRSQPQAALALCREHARKFPKGMLVQEREVLIVEALQRMGQEEEARKKSESFLKENPDTALRNKVEHLTTDAAP